MSAIFGVLRDAGRPVSPDDLQPMLRASLGWGADGTGTWHEGPVGLGHVLHRDSPAERDETAPVRSEQAPDVVLVADARLSARADLVRELGLTGVEAAGLSDGQLILRAYLRWDEQCVTRLTGAFAFAVWDGRRGRLVCARDHFGLRPLHYWSGPQGLAFATEFEAVLACPGVPRRIDEEVLVAHFVRHGPTLRARSMYQGVVKVGPGELLVVEPNSRPRRTVYWAPGYRPELRFAEPAHYAEALREMLELVVADAVVTTRPVGAHLSGGLDSTSVAVLADRALRQRGQALIRAYSWAPHPGGAAVEDDERDRVRAVARAIGVPVAFTSPRDEDRLAFARRAAALEPNETALFETAVIGDASRHGIGVLLSGWGGDELASFNGRGHLAGLARGGRLLATLCETTAFTRRMSGITGPGLIPAVIHELRTRALEPLLPEPVRHALGLNESTAEAALRREKGITWADVHPLAPTLRRDTERRLTRPSVRETQLALLNNGHLTVRIEAWARIAAPAGIDYRFPLLDPRLVDLCLSFPGEIWLHDGWKRWVYRAAVSPLLPESLCWGEPKPEPALERALREQGSLSPDPTETTAPPEVADVLKAHREYQAGLAAAAQAPG